MVCVTAIARPAPAAERVPAWLIAEPGATARVDVAPWGTADDSGAALTGSAASIARDFSADGSRPGDTVDRPAGVRVRIERVDARRGIALVHGIGARWEAYARFDRLIPEVPRGTIVRAAGGFGGFADFYPALGTPQRHALRIATGSDLVTQAAGVAPYDPDSSDLVRIRVRALDGNLRGRSGWIAISYVGVPRRHIPAGAPPAEIECRCRLVAFAVPAQKTTPFTHGGSRSHR